MQWDATETGGNKTMQRCFKVLNRHTWCSIFAICEQRYNFQVESNKLEFETTPHLIQPSDEVMSKATHYED